MKFSIPQIFSCLAGVRSALLEKRERYVRRWRSLPVSTRRATSYCSALALILIAFIASHGTVRGLERYWGRSAVITFELPFPDDVEERYHLGGTSAGLDVSHVVLTGFFSGWNPDDPNYRMTRVGERGWRITVNFAPGDNQYKFAVHDAESGEVYWVYDRNSDIKTSDSFGGYNSVYRVYNADTARLYINIIFAGFVILLVLFFVLSPLFRRMLSFRMSFRAKIVYSALGFGLVTNLFFVAMNFSQQRELARLMVTDSSSMIHLMLVSAGVDFRQLGAKNQLVSDTLNAVLFKGMGRNASGSSSSTETVLDSFVIFDSDFNMIDAVSREENGSAVRSRMERLGSGDLESYFRSTVFLDALLDYRSGRKGKNVIFRNRCFPDQPFEFRRNAFFLGFTQFLQPIYQGDSLVGFYGAEVNPNLFGSKIMYNLLSCMLLLPLFLLFYYVLFSVVGRWITGHLNTLLTFTEKIRAGDFSSQEVIRSGDEIETLSENFNAMRERLKSQMDETNEKNRTLSDLADSLETLVEMRTSELKSALEKLEESNAKLEQISITDALTGICNRRHFDALADVAFRKAMREKTPFSVIMADIDDFKKINDTYGHPVGDQVLVAFAQCLLGNTKRPGDVVARYGGEEFIVFLENTSLEGCAVVAEKLRAAAENMVVGDEGIRFAASFGICSCVPVAGKRCEELIKSADDGLYKAKKSGKNRVCSSD